MATHTFSQIDFAIEQLNKAAVKLDIKTALQKQEL
jgi:hypothetical protein